ncbi:MAG: leucine-rich repeat protein [Clostridia bacterium]|nr:leucine-rich repeat protein [Clostridia bacterium]
MKKVTIFTWYKGNNTQRKISLYAPYVSPGMVDRTLRCSLIETYVAHPDWYDEAASQKIDNWLKKNGDIFLPLCMKNGYQLVIHHLVCEKKIRFPARVYDTLIEKAEADNDTAMKAALLSAKGQYYDLAKLNQRNETLAMNDLENPMRVHAMQKYWSWLTAGDESLCINKMKNDAFETTLNQVYVPSEIGGKKVRQVSGSVFQNAKAREIIFPEEIEVIQGPLFHGSNHIERVRFDGPVRVIPERCFQNAYKLRQVTFSGMDYWIGEMSGSVLPDTDSRDQEKDPCTMLIMQSAFENCTHIEKLFLNHAVLSDEAFTRSGLETITLRDVLVIPRSCFEDCTEMTSADIRGTVVIEYNAFCNCRNLTELHVSGHLAAVKNQAFYMCYSLKTVYMHNVRYPSVIKKLIKNGRNNNIEFVPVNDG